MRNVITNTFALISAATIEPPEDRGNYRNQMQGGARGSELPAEPEESTFSIIL